MSLPPVSKEYNYYHYFKYCVCVCVCVCVYRHYIVSRHAHVHKSQAGFRAPTLPCKHTRGSWEEFVEDADARNIIHEDFHTTL
jgi:hypothetical protein